MLLKRQVNGGNYMTVKTRLKKSRNKKWGSLDTSMLDIDIALQYAEVYDFNINEEIFSGPGPRLRMLLEQEKVWNKLKGD